MKWTEAVISEMEIKSENVSPRTGCTAWYPSAFLALTAPSGRKFSLLGGSGPQVPCRSGPPLHLVLIIQQVPTSNQMHTQY